MVNLTLINNRLTSPSTGLLKAPDWDRWTALSYRWGGGLKFLLGFLTDIKNGQEEEVSSDMENLLGRKPALLEAGLFREKVFKR